MSELAKSLAAWQSSLPSAAMSADVKAKGSAKMECENFMSLR